MTKQSQSEYSEYTDIEKKVGDLFGSLIALAKTDPLDAFVKARTLSVMMGDFTLDLIRTGRVLL